MNRTMHPESSALAATDSMAMADGGGRFTALERVDAHLIAEFRAFLADAMLERITCFSAEPCFQSLASDLAAFLGITAVGASNILLVTSRAITAAAETEARKQMTVQVVRDAA